MKHIKMKRIPAVLLICGILCLSLLGCSKQPGSPVQENTLEITEPGAQAASGNIDSSIQTSQTDGENVPVSDGEYVYDYQVSMDPIPKEIADLGGPCQGTIHAFPSKIEIGLTQRMMEEDAELRAEVENTIPKVEQYLAENIGGEFKVDKLKIRNDWDWTWICTEVSTGYQFEVSYLRLGNEFVDNYIFLSGYYETKLTTNALLEFESLIIDVFGECCHKIQIQGSDNDTDIYIVQFTDEDVERLDEQTKVLNLWKKLQNYDDKGRYNIFLLYFPTIYQDVVEQKYQDGSLLDMRLGDDKELIKVLLQKGEVKDYFYYFDIEVQNLDGGVTMDEKLKQYQSGHDTQNKIWEYWILAD